MLHFKKTKTWPLLLVSFALTFIISLCVFAALKMAPFGSSSILANDSAVQYIDFFTYLKHALAGTAGKAYSFSNSLGGGMYANWTYYLLSPFNLIFVLVSRHELPVAMLFVTALKYSAAAVTAQCYASHHARARWYTLVFSISYGLSGFLVANFLNIMWMDGVILLPLVVLGIDRLFETHRIMPYVLPLSLSFITNYYIGFMIAIFAVLYFGWRWAIHHQTHLLRKIGLFAGGSLLSGMLAAVVLIPTYFALAASRLSSAGADFSVKALYSLLDLPSKFIPGSFNFDQLSNGLPNLYMGMIALLGAVFYFLAASIPVRERLISGGLTLLLILSIWLNPLVLIWQGFRAPVWYLYRHSFIVIFWLLVLSLRGFAHLPSVSRFRLGMASITTAGCLLIPTILRMTTHKYVTVLNLTLGGVFLLVAALLLYSIRSRLLPQKWLVSGIVILLVLDMGTNAFTSLKAISFVPAADFTVTSKVLQAGYDDAKKLGSGSFYRMNADSQRSMDDPYQYNFNGISTFSSVLNTSTINTLTNVGAIGSAGRVKNNDLTWPLESLLGVKQLLIVNTQSKKTGTKAYQQVASRIISNPRYDLSAYKLVGHNDYFNIYQNPDALPVATQIYRKIPTQVQANPVLQQNAYFETLSPQANQTMLTTSDFSGISVDNVKPLTTLTNAVATKVNKKNAASITLTVNPTSEQQYLVMGENMRKNMAISINNIPVKNDPDTGSKTVSMPINSTKPTTITLTFNRGLNQIDLDHFALYTLNRTAFKQTIATAKQKAPQQRIQNGRVTLTTKANNSGYVMLTIPYEKGWQVNSKNVTLQNYRGFIGLKVPTSRSTFTLTYHTPGITQGWWLTIIGVLVAIGVTVYEYWPSKRRHLKQTKRI
ncbi:YfhO family protein [Lacticaseibacillus casei]|uniref:YfhO family protein n=1 Tax=Lacticaseibacillus casei TaxID=1582 RepID=UPI001107BAF7|nr:YfhO family protein [Lacticaseibacillus casei]TLQ51117.1 YfhO family protein [Lacticaseibacillus casei]